MKDSSSTRRPRLRGVGVSATMTAVTCLWLGAVWAPPPLSGAAEEGMFQEQRRIEQARRTDPAWKPQYKESQVIKVAAKKGVVNSFCLGADGHLVVCVGYDDAEKKAGTELQILSPAGKLARKIPLKFNPQAICADAAGQLYVGGGGKLCKLSPAGKVLLEAPAPALQLPAAERDKWKDQIKEEKERLRKEYAKEYAEIFSKGREAELDKLVNDIASRFEKARGNVTGLAVSGPHIFVATPSPASFGYMVWRLDEQLSHPIPLITRLSGCCGQMDIHARDGKLWVAHNGKHKVECYDPEGKLLMSFGRADRAAADGFGGCCEPKNLCFAANGDVVAAESGPPVVVKRFDPTGKFLGVLAQPTFKTGCVRATVAMSQDEKKIYLLEFGAAAIRVFTR